MHFLKKYDRWMGSSIYYEDLLRFSGSVIVYDKNDLDTLWVRVFYSDSDREEIDHQLKIIYTQLHSDGGDSSLPDLNIDAIDFCTFGNSKPFRIKSYWDSSKKIGVCADWFIGPRLESGWISAHDLFKKIT